MKSQTTVVAIALAAALGQPSIGHTRADDYVFEPIQSEVQKGEGATVELRLIEKATKKAVPDAVIIATRMDMAPDMMPTMVAPLAPIPSKVPGVYGFKTDLPMAGRWRLRIAAKVQGEHETVKGEVVFTAKP